MLGERVRSPGAERVHDHIEAGEVGRGEVEQVLDDGVLGIGLVLAAHDGGDVMAAAHGRLDDKAAFLAVGGDDCDLELLHDGSFRCDPWAGVLRSPPS